MGLQTNNRQDASDLIFLNVKHQDENKQPIKPFFEVMRKQEDGTFAPSGETPDVVTGRLKKVDSKAREFTKGGKKQMGPEKATLYIQDGEETFALGLNYNIASRGLFNRILNLESGDNVALSCWRDRAGWLVLSLKQNGENVKYKYAKEELPETKKVKIGPNLIADTSEVDAFFKGHLLEFSSTVLAGKKVEKKEEADEENSIPF